MPNHECSPLLDACGPDIYSRNAFRLLGADVDATGRQIKRRVQELQAAIEVDDLADEYSGALRPDPLPTREELSQAGRVLADTQLRFIHEFFWFWPLEWGRCGSDKILKMIKAKKVREGRNQWEQIAANGDATALVAKHNLAVLGHFLALNGEQQILTATGNEELTKEYRKKLNAWWKYAFHYWTPLCRDEGFWSMLAHRIRSLDDPRLTTDFLRRFSQSLPVAFDNINADMAVAYCSRKIYVRARDHVLIMKASNAGDDDISASLRRVTEPLHIRVDAAVEQATGDIQNHKRSGAKRAGQLFESTRESLRVLGAILGESAREYIDTCDQVAQAMLVCQVAYGNETEDWLTSEGILEQCLEIVRGDATRQRIEDNLKIVRQNDQLGQCWYCKQNKGTEASKYVVKLYRVIHLAQLAKNEGQANWLEDIQEAVGGLSASDRKAAADALIQGGDPKITNRVEIKVPRCPSCKSAHIIALTFCICIGCGLAALAIWIAVANWDGWEAFWASAVGCFVASVFAMAVRHGCASNAGISIEEDVKDFPPIKELLGKEWSIGEPPATT
jgi:hypothetical protein